MTNKINEEEIQKVFGGLSNEVVNFVQEKLNSDPDLQAVVSKLDFGQAYALMTYVDATFGSLTLEEVQANYDTYKAQIISYAKTTFGV